jgi:hypothetical protein
MAAQLAVIHSPIGKRARAKTWATGALAADLVIALVEPDLVIALVEPDLVIVPLGPDLVIVPLGPDLVIVLLGPDPVIVLPALALIASATGRFHAAIGRHRTVAPSEDLRVETGRIPRLHGVTRAWELLAAASNPLAVAVASLVAAVAVASLVAAVAVASLVAAVAVVDAAVADAEGDSRLEQGERHYEFKIEKSCFDAILLNGGWDCPRLFSHQRSWRSASGEPEIRQAEDRVFHESETCQAKGSCAENVRHAAAGGGCGD